MFEKIARKIKWRLGIPVKYPSETSKMRHMVIDFCVGEGCDVGFGGDKIKKQHCAGIDYAQPYAFTGKDKVDIACDVINNEIPVPDSTYDYVYTSHLIEDFVDTGAALKKFIRILKSGGNLILVFPDQQIYEAHCAKTGQPVNEHHVHKDMGFQYMKSTLDGLPGIQYDILFSDNCTIDYNVVMVLKITKR